MDTLAALRSLVADVVREELARLHPSRAREVRSAVIAGSECAGASTLLTVAEASDRARVTPDTIRRWVAEGRLTRHQAGRLVRVARAELDTLMTPNRKRAPRRVPVPKVTKTMEELAEEMFP